MEATEAAPEFPEEHARRQRALRQIPTADLKALQGPDTSDHMKWPIFLGGCGGVVGTYLSFRVLPKYVNMPTFAYKFLTSLCISLVGCSAGLCVDMKLTWIKMEKKRMRARALGLQTDADIEGAEAIVRRMDMERKPGIDATDETWEEIATRLWNKGAPRGMDRQGRTPA
uniref:Uncharacterized protein n=1 Tax=Eutreptiella gymnastica TaxID=73025 RepID=A0A7S4GIM3_9EUGL